MAVRLIYNRIAHHARHSGYDQLAKYVRGKAYRPGPVFHLAKALPKKWLEKLPYHGTTWYWGDAIPREVEVCARVLLPRRTLYHFFYAENDLRFCGTWKRRCNNKIVGTFHQPPDFLDKHVEDKGYIRGLDGAVVVSRSQVDYMSGFLPRERVFWVPHGVDVRHWCPDASVERAAVPTFVFVGFWLRDVELAKAAIRLLADSGVAARFRIITPQEHVEKFFGLPQTDVLHSISDDELLLEYRRAHALFLPLDLSTANNAILEAMACGTGVITTRTGGIPEYAAGDGSILLEPKDVEGAVAALRRVAGHRDLVLAMGRAARARAEQLDWTLVGRQMDEVYAKVLQ
jgi:glycosyltransferase involved in cell wall biosynthesis